jgi:hypothetical protein
MIDQKQYITDFFKKQKFLENVKNLSEKGLFNNVRLADAEKTFSEYRALESITKPEFF